AKRLGAQVTANALEVDPGTYFHDTFGGAKGVLVTAVSPKAFAQATTMMRRGGTMVLNGLPPGKFDLSIFDMVLDGTTVRGSIVGTRKDLQEALDFAGHKKVAAEIAVEPLENINDIFDRMRNGKITGRIVVDMSL
ncbi:zinc-binding dehydrogenase, partial [Cronobacter dublinensis]